VRKTAPRRASLGISSLLMLLSLTLVSGIATGQPASMAAGPSKTLIRHVRPVNAKGELNSGYRVVRTLTRGTCAISDFVSGAWRCYASNDILDPCWAESGGPARVVCLGIPWDRKLWRVNLSSSLPPDYIYPTAPVWESS
jgi:hypothetical protein